MKKLSLITLNLLALLSLSAQNYVMIDNKGNRNQTYPAVTATNPEIEAMMAQVDTLNIYNSIAWMQQFIRDAESPEALIVQNWLVEQYESMGMEPSLHYFINNVSNDSIEAGNVYVLQQGTVYPDEYIIVSSHYDHPDGPGADDNASGTAGVLEIARILSQYSFDRSIIYMNFNFEEGGGFGSLGFAMDCALQNKNILGVFNLDMIGWYPPELDTIKMHTACYHMTQNLYDYYTSVANLYLPETPTLWLTRGERGGGDHQRIYIYDYPAIYLGDIEYISQHPCYHRPCDTIGSGVNNFALAEAFVKATIAATAELANGKLPPQNFAATCNESKIYLRWDVTNYAQSYKLFRDNELIAEINDNYFEDNNANDGLIHDYYVKAVDADGIESNESYHEKTKVSSPLTLPYFNDFDENTDGLRFFDDSWIHSSNIKITTMPECTILETDWFSIPLDAPYAKFYFDYSTDRVFNFMPMYTYRILVEATTDRIYWHKLDQLKKSNGWKHREIPLNDFIGEPFVQLRLIVENTQRWTSGITKETSQDWVAFDNFAIDFSGLDVPEVNYEPFDLLEICPNPASSTVEIKTDLDDEYNVAIYNIMGIKVLEIQEFTNGTLDISALPSGIYFIKATKDGKGIAKRIVKE